VVPFRTLLGAALSTLLATTMAIPAYAGDRPLDADAPAPVDPHASTLGLFAGAGYLGSPGASGGAFLTGLRLGVGEHFAGSVDLGYGLLSAPSTIQDRWWVIPAAALVIHTGTVRLDLGVGAGVGTSSGYTTLSAYAAEPFTPLWHYTVPAARAHLGASVPLTRSLDLFARADVASLLFVGSEPGVMDTTWLALWIGVTPRLL
jgi:hypothetical protein